MLDKQKNQLKQKGETYLRVKVIPGAGENKILNVMEDDTIKLSIASKAEKGKANQSLINFLAQEFSANKKNVKIISGFSSRLKLIKIKN